MYEESVQAMYKDRAIREKEFELKEADFSETIKELGQRISNRQEVNYKLNKDYFEYKHVI